MNQYLAFMAILAFALCIYAIFYFKEKRRIKKAYRCGGL